MYFLPNKKSIQMVFEKTYEINKLLFQIISVIASAIILLPNSVNARRINRLHSIFLFSSFFFFLLTGCTGIHKISNTNLAPLYHESKTRQGVEFFVYHFNQDSSRLCLKIPLNKVSFKRNESGVLESQLSLQMLVFSSYETKKITDSLRAVFKIAFSTDTNVYVLKSFVFKRPRLQTSVMQVSLNDLVSHSTILKIMELTHSAQSAESFLIIKQEEDAPAFETVFGKNISIKIVCSNNSNPLFVNKYNRNFPLAVPPFSNQTPSTFFNSPDSIFVLAPSYEHSFSLNNKGYYYFRFDTLDKAGLTLARFDDDYPAFTKAHNLSEPLRYLTSNEEYGKILNAEDKKEAIDDFWLEVSGSRERARFLIKSFYGRAQAANVLFTSYLEGWKSDRGMIYLVFGPPQVVYRSDEGEYWDYGNFDGYGSLNFSFIKKDNPLTTNDYVLVRKPMYKPVWYLAVENWRQGRIRAEE